MHQTIKRRSFLRLALAGLATSLTTAGCVRVRIHIGSKEATSVTQTVGSPPELRVGTSVDSRTVQPAPTPALVSEAEAEAPPPPALVMPEHIIAPRIGLDADVIEIGWARVQEQGQWYSRWQTVSGGVAGFHSGSPFPGSPGNIVISGHHNIEGKVFERVHQLEPGDLVSLVSDDVRYDYVVEERLLLRDKEVSEEQRRQNAAWIAPTGDSRLTLVTCWPATGNDYRIVVIARPKPDVWGQMRGNGPVG